MNNRTACHIALASIAGLTILTGCAKQPDVTVNPAEPGSTTIIHDKTPANPPSTVVVTPPAAPEHTETHTETNTNNPPPADQTNPPANNPPSSSSTTTTTG
jgi:hypothetical protein